MVGINTSMISTDVAPFCGIKEREFGREGSKYVMDDYLEMMELCWGVIRENDSNHLDLVFERLLLT